MRIPLSLLLLMLLSVVSCGDGTDPEAIIRRAIDAHGGDHLDGKQITFDFREYTYTIVLDGGFFQYERERLDSIGYIHDVLNNDGIYRQIDGRRIELSEERSAAYFSSLNSVAYFMLLPFKLEDRAVRARYLAAAEIRGEPYHEVEVTFAPEGGGRDYQDRFVYWFHRDEHTMDYLAYDYVTDETGTRFREAFNARTIGGIRFQDYYNYTSEEIAAPGDSIERFDVLFEADRLDLVSTIEANNLTVEPIQR